MAYDPEFPEADGSEQVRLMDYGGNTVILTAWADDAIDLHIEQVQPHHFTFIPGDEDEARQLGQALLDWANKPK